MLDNKPEKCNKKTGDNVWAKQESTWEAFWTKISFMRRSNIHAFITLYPIDIFDTYMVSSDLHYK